MMMMMIDRPSVFL